MACSGPVCLFPLLENLCPCRSSPWALVCETLTSSLRAWAAYVGKCVLTGVGYGGAGCIVTPLS